MKSIYHLQTIILLFISLLSLSKAEWNFDGLFDIDTVTMNPYRVLGVQPWRPMKEIKKRYTELILLYHPDKSHSEEGKEKFIQIQAAYEAIKTERKEQDIKSLWEVIVEAFRETSYIEGIYYIILLCCWLLYYIVDFCQTFGLIVFFVFQFNERLIPHWYNDTNTSIIVALIIGAIGYKMRIVQRIKDFIWGIFAKCGCSCFKDNVDAPSS